MTAPTNKLDVGAMMTDDQTKAMKWAISHAAKDYDGKNWRALTGLFNALLSASKPAAQNDGRCPHCHAISHYVECPSCGMDSDASAAPAQSREWDAYRLKVAEDCNERLMSACSDAGCPDGVNMADWIRGLGMLAHSCVAPAPDKRLPSREEIQNLRDHGHGEEAAYWEEALRKAAPQPSQPAQSGEAVGEIEHNQVEGFYFQPYVSWTELGVGAKLYAAPQPSQTAVALDDERAAFEEAWAREMNIEVFDLYRCDFPMMAAEKQPYACHETNRGWIIWQAARAASPQPVEQTRALTDDQTEDLQEAREILENMVRSVELDGNYSTEATCTFLRQALQCLPVPQPASGDSDV
jgi:hypothetical protein